MNQLSLVECNHVYSQDRLVEFALESEDNLTHKLGEILNDMNTTELSDANCDIDTDADEAMACVEELLESFELVAKSIAEARTKKERENIYEELISHLRDDTDYILEKLTHVKNNSDKIHKLVD